MKIKLASILVDDQTKALKFYTKVLGFKKKMDVPIGEDRWLTVVSSENPEGVELLLEPDYNPVIKGAAKKFKKALVEQGIPYTSFGVKDIQKEYERMKKLGVKFVMKPTKMNYGGTDALFDDTCGNLINLHQE